jgi:hypothetical protein
MQQHTRIVFLPLPVKFDSSVLDIGHLVQRHLVVQDHPQVVAMMGVRESELQLQHADSSLRMKNLNPREDGVDDSKKQLAVEQAKVKLLGYEN